MQQLSITDARRLLMNLAVRLGPGESVEVMKRRRAVLHITRPAETRFLRPLQALDFALDMVVTPCSGSRKRAVASRYKTLLYGSKKRVG